MEQEPRFYKLRVSTRDGDLIAELEKRDPDQLAQYGRQHLRTSEQAEQFIVLDPDGRCIETGGIDDGTEMRTDIKRGDQVNYCEKRGEDTILITGTVRAIGLKSTNGVPLIEIAPERMIANGTCCDAFVAPIIYVPATCSNNERADACLKIAPRPEKPFFTGTLPEPNLTGALPSPITGHLSA